MIAKYQNILESSHAVFIFIKKLSIPLKLTAYFENCGYHQNLHNRFPLMFEI